MRKIWNAIWFIPKLLVRFFISLVWSLFKTLLFLAVIGALLFTYAKTSDSDLANFLSRAFNEAELFVNSRATKDTLEVVGKLATDSQDNVTQARWSNRQATIYIKTTDETFHSAYQEAIERWNTTGVFTFVLSDDESSADIIADDMTDSQTQAAGLTDTQMNTLTNYLVHADVYLNSYFLLNERYGYSFDRIVNTASHELGHAIGLSHDDSEDSVMQTAGSYFDIQPRDIEAVNTLYN